MEEDFAILRLILSRVVDDERNENVVFTGESIAEIHDAYELWATGECRLKNMGLSDSNLDLGDFLIEVFKLGIKEVTKQNYFSNGTELQTQPYLQ